MSSLKKYADGRLYTCKPDPKTGIYYIHWTTPDRRSKRKTTGARAAFAKLNPSLTSGAH